MSVQIKAKAVNGRFVPNFFGYFSYDKFDPDAIAIEFTGGNVWLIDRELLWNGGDFGGDVAVTVSPAITTIELRGETTKATVIFPTPDVRDFLHAITVGISIPVMREAMIDNLLVEIFTDIR